MLDRSQQALGLLLLLVLMLGSGCSQAYLGRTDCPWGSPACNRCVEDVETSFARLRTHGDILGFHIGSAHDPSRHDHWQGVQRVSHTQGPDLIVSRDEILCDADGSQDEYCAGFVVVDFPSRTPADGRRFRSNRLSMEHTNNTAPPSSDVVVAEEIIIDARFDHAGGIQIAGDLLAVGLERGQALSQVVLYDISNPSNPIPIKATAERQNKSAGAVALGQLNDGRYLLIVAGWDSNQLDFYVSSAADLRANSTTLDLRKSWDESELQPAGEDFRAYQALNLVTECRSGALYLIGTARSGGDDWADLFRVSGRTLEGAVLSKVDQRHMFCGYDGTRQCDFLAAAGAYVDPDGQLFLYSTEHDNDGPPGGAAGFVKFEEFRPVPHSSCAKLEEAWVELYENDTFEGRSVMADYRDRALRDWSDYDRIDDLTDEISSVRWCIQSGYSYELFEDKDFRGDVLTLTGTGAFQGIADLKTESFGDTISSSRWP